MALVVLVQYAHTYIGIVLYCIVLYCTVLYCIVLYGGGNGMGSIGAIRTAATVSRSNTLQQ